MKEMIVDEAIDESIVKEYVWELGMREEEKRVMVLAEEESSLEEEVNDDSIVVEIVANERCVEML